MYLSAFKPHVSTCSGNEASSQTPPPPRFAWSPSPAVAGADERPRSRDACAPELCLSHAQESSPREGEAERRQAHHPLAAPSGAAAASSESARLSALHRGARQGLVADWLNSRPCFLGRGSGGRYPPSPIPVQG